MRTTPITTTGESFHVEPNRSELWAIAHAAMEEGKRCARKGLMTMSAQHYAVADSAYNALADTHCPFLLHPSPGR
jgi:hypothetical protein